MVTFMVQFGNAHLRAARGSNLLQPLLALLFVIALSALVLPLLGLLVPRSRAAVRSWSGRRRRRREDANAERRARAMMSELCPHGWTAQITLFAGPERRHELDRVALDWTEFEDESGRPAVSRRVWGSTIVEALEAMVADRQTDETLEQIERGALASWPD